MENKKVLVIIGIFISICLIVLSTYKIVEKSNKVNNDNSGKNKSAISKKGPIVDLSDVYIDNNKQLGVIGIAYLDPTNLSKTCNKSNTKIGEGIDGCMKWYIYADNDDNYIMILDHNTNNNVKWNREDTVNLSYNDSVLKEELDNLSNINGWKVKPRLIEAYEIDKMISLDYGNFGNNLSDFENWIHENEYNQITTGFNPKSNSDYQWLFYGNSYWTSSYISNGSCANENKVKFKNYNPDISDDIPVYIYAVIMSSSAPEDNMILDITYGDHIYGLRPVITVSKSLFK